MYHVSNCQAICTSKNIIHSQNEIIYFATSTFNETYLMYTLFATLIDYLSRSDAATILFSFFISWNDRKEWCLHKPRKLHLLLKIYSVASSTIWWRSTPLGKITRILLDRKNLWKSRLSQLKVTFRCEPKITTSAAFLCQFKLTFAI